MSTPAALTRGESLSRLRAEAAALQTRAGDLERACATIEAQIAQLAQRRGRADAKRAVRLATLRQTARETVQLLEDVVRRRGEIRARIAELEREGTSAAEALLAAEARRREERRKDTERRAGEETRASETAQRAANAVVETPADAPSAIPPIDAPPAASTAPVAEANVPITGGAILSAPSVQPHSDPRARAPFTPPAVAVTRDPVERPLVGRHRLEPVRPAGRLDELAARLRLRYAVTALLSAALVALAMLLTPLPELFGWQLFAVQTGSMAPAIPVGAIIAVQPVPAASLKVGDVITFADRNRPELRVTHRIVSLETREGQQVAITKGDANNTTDSWNVPLQSAIGRVALHVPYAGYFVHWLSTPPVRLAALTLVVVMLVAPAVLRRRSGSRTQQLSEQRSYDELEGEIEALLGDLPGDGTTPAGRRHSSAAHSEDERSPARVS